jgi:hypothetical protein
VLAIDREIRVERENAVAVEERAILRMQASAKDIGRSHRKKRQPFSGLSM